MKLYILSQKMDNERILTAIFEMLVEIMLKNEQTLGLERIFNKVKIKYQWTE